MSLRISVIIPTYNSVERLRRTIRSVLDQGYAAHEIIVVDDGSIDDTASVAELFGDAVRYVRTANGGQQRARNHGVELATGEWIALLDHDDLWEPGYLAEIEALVTASGVDVAMSNSRTWQEDGSGGGGWKDENRFLTFAPPGYWQRVGASPADRWSILDRYDYASYLAWHPQQTSMFSIRRDLYRALGGFDERMRGMGSENFEFEIRALRAARVGLIWAPLVRMIRHDSNASLDGYRMTMDLADTLLFARENHGLDATEQAIVDSELERRLPLAISSSFTLGRYDRMRAYLTLYRGPRTAKMRVKTAVAALPRPLGDGIKRLLRV